MMHDFHITENYAVFMDLPLLFKSELVAASKIPFVFDKSQGARCVKYFFGRDCSSYGTFTRQSCLPCPLLT